MSPPGWEPAAFRADVQRIADRFGADPARLAEAIRLAEALGTLGTPSQAAGAGFLAAARDRDAAGEKEETEP